MELRFVGCGDAFGSGGRLNTCFHLTGDHTNALIDCGASSLVGLKRAEVDCNAIRAILITHFHADHFAGLPFFILNAQLITRRTMPLIIAGPPGINERLPLVMEATFAGSSQIKRDFQIDVVELAPGEEADIAGLAVTPFAVQHGKVGGPFYGYRVEAEGRVVAYTGDTEWTDALVPLGHEADLLIAEAYTRKKRVPWHLDLATLEEHLPEIRPKRLILTHMSEDMLSHRGEVPYQTAEDGLVANI
ncbi:MAG: MBL fold metallo-hydrolase [Devosia sp.]